METLPISATTVLATIADSLCRQIMAYQAAMAARTESPGVPTLQDVNLQSKLIASVLRLQKQIAILQKAQNADLPTAAQQPNNTLPLEPVHPPGAPEEPEHMYDDPPPLSRKDFNAYKHILKDYSIGNKDTKVAFNNTYVNKQWLEYNLLTYYLPIEERRFIVNEARYHDFIDHERIKEDIQVALDMYEQQAA